MFAQKLVREAKERAVALKQQLVELYSRLQGGALTDVERAKLAAAIDEIKGRMEAETRRLGAGEKPPEAPQHTAP